MKDRAMWARVVSLSLLPAVWAVAAGLAGFTVAAVAMLSATVVVQGAKTVREHLRATAGFVFGLACGYFTNWLFTVVPGNPLVSVPIILIVVVAVIIIVQNAVSKIADLFAWLGSFSIALSVLGLTEPARWNAMLFQLCVSMLVGIWVFAYVGGKIQSAMLSKSRTK